MQPIKTLGLSLLKPIPFIRQIFSKKSLRNFIEQMNDPGQSDGLKAFSAGLGVFMGIIPVWGLQTVAAIFLSVVFKLNKALVLLFSQVSLPPLMPVVVFLSYRAGAFWISDESVNAHDKAHSINLHFQQYLYGSITLAVLLSVLTGLAAFATLKVVKMMRQQNLGLVN